MQLLKEERRYWDKLIEGTERVTAQGDIIVPDVKPDVLKVLEINARSVITQKGITTGGIYAEGKVYVNILYVADGAEDETGCIKTELEFRAKIDSALVNSDMKLKVDSDVSKIDFILLNSRKLSVKAAVCVNYEVVGEKMLNIPTELEECGECMEKTVKIDKIGVDEEYGFTVRGAVEIPTGKPSVREIIKTDVKVIEKEIKGVASKLIVNGKLGVCVLYFTDDMKIDYCEGEIPFTEVFSSENVSEEDCCSANFRIGDIYTELSEDNDGDIRIINLECFTGMGVRANRVEEIKYISDCYCAGCKTRLGCEEKEIRGYVDYIIKETNERNVIEPDGNNPEICKVYNVVCEEEVTRCEVLDGGVKVCGRVKLYILYLTDNTKCPVYSIKSELPFEYYIESKDARAGMDCEAKVYVENLMYSMNSKGGVEIKYTLKKEIRITNKMSLQLICDVETEENREENDIVIYFVKKGDSLWSVGKSYGVRVNDLIELNKLENDEIKEGQKLLIPAC